MEVVMLRIPTSLPDGLEALVHTTIGCALEVHRELGPGFLERIYQEALCAELTARSIRFDREWPVTVMYRGHAVGGHRLDLVVERRLIVEIKTVDRLDRVHVTQLLSYLAATKLRVGLLMNFRAETLKQGIRRVVR